MRINLGEKFFNLKSNLTCNKYNRLLFFVSEAQTCLLPFGREQVTVFTGYVKKNVVLRTFTMKINLKKCRPTLLWTSFEVFH